MKRTSNILIVAALAGGAFLASCGNKVRTTESPVKSMYLTCTNPVHTSFTIPAWRA